MQGRGIFAALLGCAVVGIGASAMAAPVAIFDGQFENGFGPTAEASIDSTMTYQGQNTILLSSSGAFDQLGIQGSSTTPVPVGATTVQFSVFAQPQASPASSDQAANFIVQLTGGSFPSVAFGDGNSNLWTLDGAPGNMEFSAGAWHTVTLDLGDAFSPADLTPGSTDIFHIDVQTNGDSPQSIIHLADASFIGSSPVPEPASISLLGLASVLVLKRNRKPAAR